MRTKLFALRTIFYVKLLLVSLLFSLAFALKAQPARSENLSKPQPKVDVKVNKQFDDRGNLVRYDSVYTWSYSNGTIPAGILSDRLNGNLWHGNLQKYTDSLWRSMFQPMHLMFMDPTTQQLMQSMQEALKRLPQQKQPNQKHDWRYNGGGKKAVSKATRTITI